MVLFGEAYHLDGTSSTIIFISMLFTFFMVEGILHIFETECNRRGLRGFVKKLYREFMIMGLISFILYIVQDSYNIEKSKWFSAFHFTEILLVFIGLTFLLQSALLVAMIASRNQTLLQHDSNSCEDLLIEYIDLLVEDGFMRKMFDYGPVSIPVPELREKIEYKILQEYFVRLYNLPSEFKFANYMCLALRGYCIDLVEVRPISWICLSVFAVINYGRISVIDPVFKDDVCHKFPDKSAGTAHRQLFDATRGSWGGFGGESGDWSGSGGPHSGATQARLASAAVDQLARMTGMSSGDVAIWLAGDTGDDFTAAAAAAATGGASHFRAQSGEEPAYADSNSTDDHSSGSSTVSYDQCQEYTLRYVACCLLIMFCFIVAVWFASEIYIHRLIDKVLDVEETLEWIEEEGRPDEQGETGEAEGDREAEGKEEEGEEDGTKPRPEDGDIEMVAKAARPLSSVHRPRPRSKTGDRERRSSNVSTASAMPSMHWAEDIEHHSFFRRHLYFRCLERLTENEFLFYQNQNDEDEQHNNHPSGHGHGNGHGNGHGHGRNRRHSIGNGNEHGPHGHEVVEHHTHGHGHGRNRQSTVSDAHTESRGHRVASVVSAHQNPTTQTHRSRRLSSDTQGEREGEGAGAGAGAGAGEEGETSAGSLPSLGDRGFALSGIEQLRNRSKSISASMMAGHRPDTQVRTEIANLRSQLVSLRQSRLSNSRGMDSGDRYSSGLSGSKTKVVSEDPRHFTNPKSGGDDSEHHTLLEDTDSLSPLPPNSPPGRGRRQSAEQPVTSFDKLSSDSGKHSPRSRTSSHASKARLPQDGIKSASSEEADAVLDNDSREAGVGIGIEDEDEDGFEDGNGGGVAAMTISMKKRPTRSSRSSAQGHSLSNHTQAPPSSIPYNPMDIADVRLRLLKLRSSRAGDSMSEVVRAAHFEVDSSGKLDFHLDEEETLTQRRAHAETVEDAIAGGRTLRRTLSVDSPTFAAAAAAVQRAKDDGNSMLQKLRTSSFSASLSSLLMTSPNTAAEPASSGASLHDVTVGDGGVFDIEAGSNRNSVRNSWGVGSALSASPSPIEGLSAAPSPDPSPAPSPAPSPGRPPRLTTKNRSYSEVFFKQEESANQPNQRSEPTAGRDDRSHSLTSDCSNNTNDNGNNFTTFWRAGYKALTQTSADDHFVLGRAAYGLAIDISVKLTSWLKNTLLGHHIGHAEHEADEDVKETQRKLKSIYAWSNPSLYFFVVEMCLLLQCVYIALWATNFLTIARDSYYPVLWEVALLVPLPFNFIIIKQILFTSSMLKSICTLDKRVCDLVCEDAVDERNVLRRLRKIIRNALRNEESYRNITREMWVPFLAERFFQHAKTKQRAQAQRCLESEGDEAGVARLSTQSMDQSMRELAATSSSKDRYLYYLDVGKFKAFLHSIHIFLTDESVAKIFAVVDGDRAGKISWDDLCSIVFPELKRKAHLRNHVDAARKKKKGETKARAKEKVTGGEDQVRKGGEETESHMGNTASASASVSVSVSAPAKGVPQTRMEKPSECGSTAEAGSGSGVGVGVGAVVGVGAGSGEERGASTVTMTGKGDDEEGKNEEKKKEKEKEKETDKESENGRKEETQKAAGKRKEWRGGEAEVEETGKTSDTGNGNDDDNDSTSYNDAGVDLASVSSRSSRSNSTSSSSSSSSSGNDGGSGRSSRRSSESDKSVGSRDGDGRGERREGGEEEEAFG